MANVGPVLWFLRDNAPTSTIGWSAVTPWAALTSVAAGVLRRQLATPAVGSERVFACIIAGTTLAAEPTWVVTKGAKTAEAAGPTWQEVTGQPGVNGDTADSPTWLQNKNTVVTLGLIIFDSVSSSLQIVSTAGTTGNGAQPTFSATAGTTTADNTVTWTSLGLASGFGAWAAPHARMANVFGTGWAQAGNSVFAGNDHAETQAVAMTVTATGTSAAPNFIYSINNAGTLTLAAATLLAGATLTTTGANGMTINGPSYWNGLTFNAGSGATNVGLTIGSATSIFMKMVNCALAKLGTTVNNGALNFGSSAIAVFELVNTTFRFGSTADGVLISGSSFLWKNTPAAIAGAIFPTQLFNRQLLATCAVVLDAVDLSALTGATTIIGTGVSPWQVLIKNCKLGSGVVIAAPAGRAGPFVDLVASDSAGTTYQAQRYWYQGTQVPETVVVRTGGASDGTTPVSAKLATTANSLFTSAFSAISVAQWNTVTGTNRVVTLAAIWNAAALPNNDDIWIDAEYFGSAASPQGSFANNTKANNLASGTPLPADSTSAWDSLVTARANTTSYSLGNVIKVASNPGRIFFCTTAGTSAGSEPVGYASAVDGGSVTDGSAVFRAGVRFTLTVTLSSPQPAMAGPIYVTINAAKISSIFWVDPLIALS